MNISAIQQHATAYMPLPPYNIFPVIEGDTILLRGIQPEDTGDIMEISYYDGVKASTLQEAAGMQLKINLDYLSGNSIHWGIADRTTNKILGTCGYYRGFHNSSGELGCILLPRFRGRGFMTKAMLLAIDFGLNTMELQRIYAITTRQNIHAVKLLERLGFTESSSAKSREVEFVLNEHLR